MPNLKFMAKHFRVLYPVFNYLRKVRYVDSLAALDEVFAPVMSQEEPPKEDLDSLLKTCYRPKDRQGLMGGDPSSSAYAEAQWAFYRSVSGKASYGIENEATPMDAEKVLEQALLRMSKPSAEGYFYLGQLYELDGNTRKAIRAYEEGLLLQPKRADYYLRIAGIHERANDDFLALLILDQGIQAGVARSDFHLRRGGIYFSQARYDRALEEFKKAYAMGSPQGRTGIENVAAALYNSGKKKEAEAVTASLKSL